MADYILTISVNRVLGAHFCSRWGPACWFCTTDFIFVITVHVPLLPFKLEYKLQGGKDLSGEVVCSSGLRASVYISGGYSSFRVIFPVMFQCNLVNCKQFRNFQSPQLKGSGSRGLLLYVCVYYEGPFTVHSWNENESSVSDE